MSEASSIKPLAKKEILDFLKSSPMATISAIDANSQKPESALIAFAELDTFELIFETFYETRKYHNLRANNAVALVVGWDTEHHATLQYEGRAFPIPVAEIETYRQIFLRKKTPCTEQFLNYPRVRLYKTVPSWIRYSDYTAGVPRIIEMEF